MCVWGGASGEREQRTKNVEGDGARDLDDYDSATKFEFDKESRRVRVRDRALGIFDEEEGVNREEPFSHYRGNGGNLRKLPTFDSPSSRTYDQKYGFGAVTDDLLIA